MRYLHQIASDKGFIDLHNHTNSSFGEEMNRTGITPVGLLNEAAEYANKHNAPVTFAISDHNNTHGNVEVMEEMMRNPEKYKNINFIPGCEYTVSTASVGYVYDEKGNRRPVLDGKVHMLAYGFDVNDPVVKYFDQCMSTENQYMKRIKGGTIKTGSLVFATKKWLEDTQHMKIGMEEFSKHCPITGDFNETKKGIENFLVSKGINTNSIPDWDKFVSDGQNLIRYAKGDVQEVMAMIQNAGGYTVLAHPGLYRPHKSLFNMNMNDPRNQKFANMAFTDGEGLTGKEKALNDQKMMNFYDYVFKALTEDAYDPVTGKKLDGIVGYELLHSANQGNPKKFEQMAAAGDRYGLYVTAGSDSHGDLHPMAIFSRVIHTKVEDAVIQEKDNKNSHFAVIGCKFVDDLKRAMQTGTKLVRDKSMNVDNQMRIVKNEGNKEEIITLGDLRNSIRGMIVENYGKDNGNSYNQGGKNHGHGGKKHHGHGHRHLEEMSETERKIAELKEMKAQLMMIKQMQEEQTQETYDKPKTLTLTRKRKMTKTDGEGFTF